MYVVCKVAKKQRNKIFMKEIQEQNFSLQMKKWADLLMDYFLICFFVIGLLLSFYFNTLAMAIGLGGLSLLVYYSCKILFSNSDLYQYVLSAVLGVFMLQFFYQTHGMFEIHFFAFIGSALLIIYRNWKLQIPLAIVAIIHYALVGYLQIIGFDNSFFPKLEHISLATFIIDSILSIALFFLSGLWSYKVKQFSTNQIEQSFKIGKIHEEGEQSEVLIAMSESLKASNAKFKKANTELRTLFENIEEVFFSIKVEFLEGAPCFTTLQISPACTNVYGYGSEDFFRDPSLWRTIIVKEDEHIIDKHFMQLLRGRSVVYEHRILHKDRTIRWVQTKIKPTLGEESILVRIDGITSDITKKKLVEESLLTSEANLRTIFENADTGYLLLDVDSNVVSFNQQMQKFSEFSFSQILKEGSHFINYIPEERREHIKKMIADAFKGATVGYEKSNQQPDGSLKWYYIQLLGVRDKDNKIFALTVSVSDITERKNTEAELKKNFEKISVQEKLMKSAEKLANIGSWQNDMVNNSVHWSDETFRLYGYEPREYPASFGLFLKHLHPEDKLYVTSSMQEAVQLYDSLKLSFRIIDKYGAIKHIEAAMIIERDEEGNPVNVLGFKQDVTEKVLLKNNLEDEKLYRLQRITEAVITAQEKERLFLGEELHDNINPILATVKLYMDCAITDESLRIDLIKDSKTFLSTAMEEIRTLSRSLVPPSLKEITLLDAVEDLINNIKKVNNLDINTNWEDVDDDSLDEKLKLTIFRIIQEQLNNIFKYAQANTVMVQLKQNGSKLQLIIKDDGVGFDTSKKRKGVGLQNISSRADLFNGNMNIISQPGKGCNLVVNFYEQTDLREYTTLAKAI
jgi:PAS domain S-box-containing protein